MIIIMIMMMMMSTKIIILKLRKPPGKKLDSDRDNKCAMYFLTTENMFINLHWNVHVTE